MCKIASESFVQHVGLRLAIIITSVRLGFEYPLDCVIVNNRLGLPRSRIQVRGVGLTLINSLHHDYRSRT